MTWAERVARARAEGVCVRCGDPYTDAPQECRACQILHADAQADRLAARKAAGLCRCGRPVMPGRETCAVCYLPTGTAAGWPKGRLRKVREAEQQLMDNPNRRDKR